MKKYNFYLCNNTKFLPKKTVLHYNIVVLLIKRKVFIINAQNNLDAIE